MYLTQGLLFSAPPKRPKQSRHDGDADNEAQQLVETAEGTEAQGYPLLGLAFGGFFFSALPMGGWSTSFGDGGVDDRGRSANNGSIRA